MVYCLIIALYEWIEKGKRHSPVTCQPSRCINYPRLYTSDRGKNMYYHHYGYGPHVNQYTNYPYRDHPYMPQHQQAYDYYNPFYPADPGGTLERQQSFRGQPTWTEGGQVTECGIPWSNNN